MIIILMINNKHISYRGNTCQVSLFCTAQVRSAFVCQTQMGLSLQEVKEVSWVMKQLPD